MLREHVAQKLQKAEAKLIAEVEERNRKLGVEHDSEGNRAKAYLYCLETRARTQAGWFLCAPTWVISKSRKIAAVLVPDPRTKALRHRDRSGVSEADMVAADKGTIQGGRIIHTINGEDFAPPSRPSAAIGKWQRRHGKRIATMGKIGLHPDRMTSFRSAYTRFNGSLARQLEGVARNIFPAVTEEDENASARVQRNRQRQSSAVAGRRTCPRHGNRAGEKTDELIRERGLDALASCIHVHATTILLLASVMKRNHEAEISLS